MNDSEEYKAGDDKFPELTLQGFPQQLQWKLNRAKQHFMEFEREVAAWMNRGPSGPGELVRTPESSDEKPLFMYAPTEPVPARFGIIAGDYLQNLRSVFDYLVWQLILANGRVPDETSTAFPVCKKRTSFNDAKKKRLVGVPEEAIQIIERLMPYAEGIIKGSSPHAMQVLDELTNANKHRQVLSTKLATILKPPHEVPFPHIELEVLRHDVPGEKLLGFLVFEGGIMRGVEVTVTLKVLMDWVGYEVLPQFEKFF